MTAMPDSPPAPPPLRERRITLGHLPLRVVHPADPEALVDAIDPAAPGAAESIPYWAEVWPAAVALGRHLVGLDLAGRRAIELGAGVGLAGLAAARAGASVLLTDVSDEALGFARRNAELNGLAVDCARLDWFDHGGADLLAGAFDLVLAADVLYERRLVEPLARLVPHLLAPGGTALLTDPRRPYAREFTAAIAARASGLAISTRSTFIYWEGRAREIDLIAIERLTSPAAPAARSR
jgi:predicted nicotinamide N-methyase